MQRPNISTILSKQQKQCLLDWAESNNVDCVSVQCYELSVTFGNESDNCADLSIDFYAGHEFDWLREYGKVTYSISELVFGIKSWEKE